jgi:hypothetical protein
MLGAVWILGTALVTSGCQNFMVNLTVDSTAPVLKRATKSMDEEDDVQLARDALPAQIKTIDGFLAASPEQPDMLELTAMAYVQYAFGFLEDDLETLPPGESPARQNLVSRCTSLYDRAFDLGLRHIALSRKEIPGLAHSGSVDDLTRGLTKTGRDSVPGLTWAGMGLASAINLHRDDIGRVGDLPKAVALLERSNALDPSYYVYSAPLALAIVYSSQGKAAGGDPDRGKKFFDLVISATHGKYLMAKVLYARYYATVTLDRDLYEKTLKEVLATPGSVWPEQRLANELARSRAARYLRDADELF